MKLGKNILSNLLLIGGLLCWATNYLVADETVKFIEQRLSSQGIGFTTIEINPQTGWYQVRLLNSQGFLFVKPEADYFIFGDLFSLNGKTIINLSELNNQQYNARLIQQYLKNNPQAVIKFNATGKVKKNLYVFTDVDCVYCRQFHSSMNLISKMGISVTYFAFPRNGLNGKTAEKMIAVWCSEDRNAAMDKVKAGGDISNKSNCNNPVRQQYELGISLGVRNTPVMFLDTGEKIYGYLNPSELKQHLNL